MNPNRVKNDYRGNNSVMVWISGENTREIRLLLEDIIVVVWEGIRRATNEVDQNIRYNSVLLTVW